MAVPRVLNACRRQRNLHIFFSAPEGRRSVVLNACRRQRNLHEVRRMPVRESNRCSTPVGVKGISTNCRMASRAGRCAQRLSASKESPRRDESKLLPLPNVLNACRRQRDLHPVGYCGPGALPVRAQRLSASKESPLGRAVGRPPRHSVLNACRRQRNHHHNELQRRWRTPHVLNACRRQGISTIGQVMVSRLVDSAQRLSASKESPRREPVMAGRRNSCVLNACRRQRNLHCRWP